ncbi:MULTISPECIES: NUDIX hydrolase [Paenibacillus]|uniref:NUDIX hydrolase n=1 Tax=Paenibacillus naphthalenovorans TaxID=162209 RepID=A0A0U2W4D6_9BACL|nr:MULTISPECIES: NUDIX domain-containing protein [Paenibacillus]ALS23428.1 NUDIX hydrolase [Paenibacillus naphthalenovorans]NTZ17046.1 NUDIX domain-containing protein [Paenibacillus sp. JMULE4]GCL72901.1 NUDIX domain-containing protein [Paenibacillus naphthalenovorans]SDJ27011.1 ADP-ribose pyrophosphatase YjhB, NUDIX family [Paenibacillus naphthalenovorans]
MSKPWFQVNSAVYMLFIRNGKILMLRRSNTGYEDGKLSLVAGKLDGNEEVKRAAVREAEEESGIKLSPEDLEVACVMHRLSDKGEWIDFFLKVNRWEGEPVNKEPDKCSEMGWFPLDRLPDDTIPHVRKAIRNVLDGVFYDSYGWDEIVE